MDKSDNWCIGGNRTGGGIVQPDPTLMKCIETFVKTKQVLKETGYKIIDLEDLFEGICPIDRIPIDYPWGSGGLGPNGRRDENDYLVPCAKINSPRCLYFFEGSDNSAVVNESKKVREIIEVVYKMEYSVS